jgi:pilus assembly protein CpaE
VASLVPGETLRLLLVSAHEEMRNTVSEALARRAGDHRLYWVSQADLAASRAEDVLPHIVLVDDEPGGANPVTLIGQLAGRLPRAAILAMVEGNDLDMARRAMLAGARAFVTKPLDGEELLGALRQVLAQKGATAAVEQETPVANGRIITFCAAKGGTGQSILATNTAIALRQASGQPVALIDADRAAPALDVALNLDSGRNITDLLPKMARLDADLVVSAMAPHASGIRVMLAPPPADLTHHISLPQVQQMLAWLKRIFSWVIVDLGLLMDETAFGFLDSADRIIITVLPEMVGLRNTRLMLEQLLERGYPPEKVWMVLNRSTLRGGVPVRDIEERLKVRINHQVPDDQPLATISINRGVPVMASNPNSAVGRSVRNLAAALIAETKGEAVGLAPAPIAAGRFRFRRA